MDKASRPILIFLLCLAVFLAVGGGYLWMRNQPDAQGRVIPFFENINLTDYGRFAKAVASPVRVEIYDGLPHPMWENELYEADLRSQATMKSHGHYFYSTAIAPSPADAARLQALATNAQNFAEWGGLKTCGGYHPDWLIQWTTSDGKVHELHLCFGCHEAKFYGPGYQLYCDISPNAYEALKEVLTAYASSRP